MQKRNRTCSSFFVGLNLMVLFLSVCRSKVCSHLPDGFVVDEISSRYRNAEFCFYICHHADKVKRTQAESRLKMVFSRDFVSFHVIFKDCDKFFE